MLTEVQDRDAIVSRAIEIASAEERDAYIARACGNDADLRRQVEKEVAAHFQAGKLPDKPAVAAASGAYPSAGQDLEQAGTHQAARREAPSQATSRLWRGVRTHSRGLATALVLLAAIGGSISLAVWAWRVEEQERTAAQEAMNERDHARKAEEETNKQRDEVETVRQATAKERDQALTAEQAAQRSAKETKAVLAFLNDKVLSAGRPKGWAGGLGKDVTLRQAVDAAESKVGEAFADRPLAEASVRETLGSTYLDLGEAALAVKQYERALALREAMQGEENPDTSACRNKLAVAYRFAGLPAEASRLYDQNLISPSRAAALAIHGSALLTRKKPVEAELKLRECLTIRQKIRPDDWTTFDTKSMLGESLLDQKKYADAEPQLLSGYDGMKQREAKIPPEAKVRLTKALERLVRLYEAWNKKDKAAQWRKALEVAEAAKKI